MPVGPVVPPGICHPDPSSVIPTEAKRAEGSAGRHTESEQSAGAEQGRRVRLRTAEPFI